MFAGDLHYLGSADTRPAELLPIALLREHSLTFDRFGYQTADLPFDFVRVNGRVVSAYPIVPGLLNVPIYLIADWKGVDLLKYSGRLSAMTAALVSALSVVLMFLILTNLFTQISTALLGACIYAFGTCVWSVASKAIWQHGPSLLFMLGGLAFLTASTRIISRWVWLSGMLLGLSVWNRPTNVVFFVAITIWLVLQNCSRVLFFVGGAAVPVTGMLVYSWLYLGRVDTLGQLQTFDAFRGDLGTGLAGLLLSPNRGLFVFSPVFVLSLVGAVLAVKHRKTYSLPVVLAAAVLVELLIYGKWYSWWGGVSFGYRLIIETVPSLVILACIAWREWVRCSARRVAAAALLGLVSVYIQWLGATYYPCGFNTDPNNIDEHPERLWDIRAGEIVRCTALLRGNRGELAQVHPELRAHI